MSATAQMPSCRGWFLYLQSFYIYNPESPHSRSGQGLIGYTNAVDIYSLGKIYLSTYMYNAVDVYSLGIRL